MTPTRTVLVNEDGVTYSVLGRSRWRLRWPEILAVQAYAKGTSTYRVGFRLESSRQDAELNTRDDLLSRQDIIEAFRAVATAARRRAIEVGDPLGWLLEESDPTPSGDPRVSSTATRGRWTLSREPARALAIAGASSILLVLLALATSLTEQLHVPAMPAGRSHTLLILGIGLGIAIPLAYADSIAGLRVSRHGIGMRLASGREYIVRWSEVERVSARLDRGLLRLATSDGKRRPAWIEPMDCREIVAWMLANQLGQLELLDPDVGRDRIPGRKRAHSPIAAANSSESS